MVEISFHGNPVLVNAALSSIYKLGIRNAEGGEFSKRAFLNGKIDLTQAESIQELISAKSIDGVHSAYNQLHGSLKNNLDFIKDKLLSMKAIMEAKIDFPDEDTLDSESEVLKENSLEVIKNIDNLLESYKSYRMHNKGIDIVIAGKPNVGKSSLLNALLKEERAIVSDIAGTTRDFIKENLYIGGIPVHITDTAGIHSSSEYVEKIGIDKSIEKINNSDIVFLILDISKPITIEDKYLLDITSKSNRIIIGNKIDIGSAENFSEADIYISAKNNENMDKFIELIKSRVSISNNDIKTSATAITQRHYTLLLEVKEIIEKISSSIYIYPIDMLCIDLERAINLISEITGDNYTEKVLDIVFSSFCIGK